MSVAEAAHPQVPPQPRVVRDAAMDWVKFDAELARDGAVDPVDKALYAALASFVSTSSGQQRATEADGFDAPTRRVLAACIGRSVDTVDRATKRLEERGLIAVERRRDPDNPRSNLPSVYRLLDHERWDERAAERAESRRKARQKPLAASVRPPSPQPCSQVAAPMRPGGSRISAAVPLPSKKSSLEKFSLSEEACGIPKPESVPLVAEEREILSAFEDPNPTRPAPLPGVDAYTAHLAAAAQGPAPRHNHQQPQEAPQTPRQPPPTPTPPTDAYMAMSGAVGVVFAGWAAGAGVQRPPASVRGQLAGQVAELAAEYATPEELRAIAEFAGHRRWTDLGRAAMHPECAKRLAAVRPGQAQGAGGRERCPDHPARYRKGCLDCAMTVPA